MRTLIINGSRIPAAVVLKGPRAFSHRAAEELVGRECRILRDEAVFADGDACTHFYKVVSGTVRTLKLVSDGRRQIDAFHLAGDVFGVEGGERHRLSAEAVDNIVVVAYARNRFADIVQHESGFGPELIASVLCNLDRAHDHMVLLGRKTALEKVATFLLDLADRRSECDGVDLPMPRGDIADHLGLTIETVSRTLTQMMRDGVIQITGRTITFARKHRLQAMADRRLIDQIADARGPVAVTGLRR
jgi:CRP/FNR family nitrogen fixation transcriptional regulator